MSTLVLIAVAALVWLLDFTVAPDDGLAKTLLPALATGLSALALARLLERALLRLLAGRARLGSHSDRLHTMLAMLIYAATVLGWLHYALGLNVTSLLATSAVVTLVLGLALQATLGNLFTGLSLELERQLRVGDYIFKGLIEGEVVALKWRSVFLRTSNNTRIVLPNNGLTTDAVEIVPGGQPSRHTVFFAVRSNVPPMDVLAVTEDVLRSGVRNIHLALPPSAILVGPAPERGFLRYGARYYTLECLERSNIASNLQVRLWYALSRKGIAMAGWGVPPRDDGRLVASCRASPRISSPACCPSANAGATAPTRRSPWGTARPSSYAARRARNARRTSTWNARSSPACWTTGRTSTAPSGWPRRPSPSSGSAPPGISGPMLTPWRTAMPRGPTTHACCTSPWRAISRTNATGRPSWPRRRATPPAGSNPAPASASRACSPRRRQATVESSATVAARSCTSRPPPCARPSTAR